MIRDLQYWTKFCRCNLVLSHPALSSSVDWALRLYMYSVHCVA